MLPNQLLTRAICFQVNVSCNIFASDKYKTTEAMKKIHYSSQLLVAMLMTLLSASYANAQSPTAPAKGFNIFVKNNFTTISSECEGPVAMGGNLIANGGYVFNAHNVGNFTVGGKIVGLVVGGQVILNNGSLQVNNNRHVKVGNGSNITVWYQDNNGNNTDIRITPSGQPFWHYPNLTMSADPTEVAGTPYTISPTNNPVIESNVINFVSAFDTLQNNSLSLSACTDNVTLTYEGNGGIWYPLTYPYSVPNNAKVKVQLSSGANIMNIDGSQLNNIQEMQYENQGIFSTSTFLIINVNAPGSFTWAPKNVNGISHTNCQYVLYNFYNTTNLTIAGYGEIMGTIFAPFANINKSNNYSNVEGQIIGLSYSSVGGESNYRVFLPSYTGCGAPPITNTDADFSVNNNSQCLSSNSFVFTNNSTGSGTLSYNWNFGDGTTSTAANPTKTYATTGTYNVRLIATGIGGTDTAYQTVTVSDVPAQPGNFTASAATVYRGQINVTYTVPNVSGVTYTWSYSGTGANFSGNTNSITIDFDTTATSGELTVYASNSCGQSAVRTINILVKPYMTWTCDGGNNQWANPANWDGGFVPYGTISVYIPSSASCNPVIDDDEEVRDITVDDDKEITINCSHKLKIKGGATIKGIVCGCGKMVIAGQNRTQHLAGFGTICNLELDNDSTAIIVPGDTIHICKTYKPTSGKLYTNNGLELLSDSANCNGVILEGNGCEYIVGNVIVNRFVPGGRRAFRFLGHPFQHSIGLNMLTPWLDITGTGGAANGFTPTLTNNPSAFWYNTQTGNGSTINDTTGWIPFTHTNGQGVNAWRRMQGIRVLFRGAKGQGLTSCCDYTPSSFTYKMHGPVNQCDVSLNLETNANKGFNLVGNPFPANVEMSETVRGSAISFYFSVWNPHMGVAGAYIDQPFDFSYILPAYSAFIVRSSANSNNTITFVESSKRSDEPTHTLFKTTAGSNFGSNSIQLKVLSDNGDIFWDRLLLFFNSQTSASLDNLDAEKMGNPGLDFYTLSADNKKLSIDTRPLVENEVIKLGLDVTDEDKTYTIYAEDYDVDPSVQLYLHDKYLNVVEPITQGMSYSFTVTSNPASQGINRFEINVGNDNPNSVKNIQEASAFKVQVLPNPATNYINVSFKAPHAGATQVRIVNVVGAQVYASDLGTVASKTLNIPLNNLPSGVYMVTVNCGDYNVTQRFVKQ